MPDPPSMDASSLTPAELARRIDHTALGPEVTRDSVEGLCREARELGFGAVCVAPWWVATAVELLSGSPTVVASVVGFPHGDTLSEVKALEARAVRAAGAAEVDMVWNLAAFRSGDTAAARADIEAVVRVAGHPTGGRVKVILEASRLQGNELEDACRLAEAAGADDVKTSTGFGGSVARIEDVTRMAATVGGRLGIKAAGGIRSAEAARRMLAAGATRLGCSASVAILRELGG